MLMYVRIKILLQQKNLKPLMYQESLREPYFFFLTSFSFTLRLWRLTWKQNKDSNYSHIPAACVFMNFSAAGREQVYRAELESEKRFLHWELYFSLERLTRQRLEVKWKPASSEGIRYWHKRNEDILSWRANRKCLGWWCGHCCCMFSNHRTGH